MVFKDILKRLLNKDEELNEEAHRRKIQRILDTKEMSSNERELNRFQEEERQDNIKEALEFYRQRRKEQIDFGHNALDTKSIMKSEWEVLKNKNIFKGNENSILNNHNSIIKSKNIFMRNRR